MQPKFTDEQRKQMLQAVNEREGRWDQVDPNTEVANIGDAIGLSEDDSYALFKILVDEHYIDPGRILQAGGAMPSRTGRVVGTGTDLTPVGNNIRVMGMEEFETH